MYQVIGGDQQVYGPASAHELREWIAEGRLSAQSLAQAGGAGEWRPLSSYPEFAEALRVQAAQFPAARVLLESPNEIPAVLAEARKEFNVGECLFRARQLMLANFGLLFGASFLAWMAAMTLQFLPLLGILYWLLRGVLYGGLCLLFLNCIRGRPTAAREVFRGFKTNFSQLMLVGAVSSFLTWLGFLFCALPGLYLMVAWSCSVPLVADRRMEFWTAMELSRKTVGRVWFKMLGLLVIAFLPVILMSVYTEVKISLALFESVKDVLRASEPPALAQVMQTMNQTMTEVAQANVPLIMLTKLMLLLNLPFGLGALMHAYERLFTEKSPPCQP